MIKLYPPPVLSTYHRRRSPNHSAHARAKSLDMSLPGQIKAEARRIISVGLPARIWRIIDLLACGGVLPSSHLGVSERALKWWSQRLVLEKVVGDQVELQHAGKQLGLSVNGLYALSPVGVEIAAMRHEVQPPSGYQGYTLMRVMHDVVVNEIVLRLAERLGAGGWNVEWLSKYEGALTDKNGRVILEPDAVIRFYKDEQEKAFVLEYHNEDRRARAAMKVEKYEAAFTEGNWKQQWEVETFPPVLVVFWQPIVGAGYQNAVGSKKPNCTYYGKTLKAVLEGKLDEWQSIHRDKKETLIPK